MEIADAQQVAGLPRAPLFKVVAEPNEWQKQLRAATEGAELGGKRALYVAFWGQLLDRVRDRHPDWTRAAKPPADNWITMPAPIKGGPYLSASFAANGRLRHELYIDVGDGARNLALFHSLVAARERLEDAYGRALEFEELPGKRACRVAEYREGDVNDTERHEEFIEWFIDAGVRLRRALNDVVPQLAMIPSARPPEAAEPPLG